MAERNYTGFDVTSKKKRERNTKLIGKIGHRCFLFLWFVSGIYLIFLGFSLFSQENYDSVVLKDLINISAITITGLLYFFVYLSSIERFFPRLLLSVITYISVIFLAFYLGDYLPLILRFLIGLYTFSAGIVYLINTIRLIKIKAKFGRSLISCLIFLIYGGTMLFFRDLGIREVYTLIGSYVMYIGFYFALESFRALFSRKRKERKFRPVFTLPVIISAFFPIGFFSNLNKKVIKADIEENKELFYDTSLEENEFDENEKKTNDLVIYIHTRAGLVPGFGHVDISFNDKVYCYGNYDQDSWFLGGFISDGVFVTTTPENHISHALNNDKKVLVAYTLKISNETKDKIQKKIDEILEKSYRWKPKAELADEGEIEGKPEDFDDVGSIMYLKENTEFYKFEPGNPYKTYYLLGQNCAMFANDVIQDSGIHIGSADKFVTPGSFLEFLNGLYSMQHTIVVDRKVYMLNNNGVPYLLTPEKEKELEKKVK